MKKMKIKLKHGLSQTLKAPEESTFFVKVQDGFVWFSVKNNDKDRPKLAAVHRADNVVSILRKQKVFSDWKRK